MRRTRPDREGKGQDGTDAQMIASNETARALPLRGVGQLFLCQACRLELASLETCPEPLGAGGPSAEARGPEFFLRPVNSLLKSVCLVRLIPPPPFLLANLDGGPLRSRWFFL